MMAARAACLPAPPTLSDDIASFSGKTPLTLASLLILAALSVAKKPSKGYFTHLIAEMMRIHPKRDSDHFNIASL